MSWIEVVSGNGKYSTLRVRRGRNPVIQRRDVHASEDRGRGEGRSLAADDDPGRWHQPRPDQDGRVLPRHDLRQSCRGCKRGIFATRPMRPALAELVNAQFRQPFAVWWGDGTTSSSDGQRFKAGGKAESTGHINPKYMLSRGGCSTPTFPISTRPSTPRRSTSAYSGHRERAFRAS